MDKKQVIDRLQKYVKHAYAVHNGASSDIKSTATWAKKMDTARFCREHVSGLHTQLGDFAIAQVTLSLTTQLFSILPHEANPSYTKSLQDYIWLIDECRKSLISNANVKAKAKVEQFHS